MKHKKINYGLILCIIIVILLAISYIASRPILRSEAIRTFKKTCKEEHEYIKNIKFEYDMSGIRITIHTKDITEENVAQILNTVQSFISTDEFVDFVEDKIEKEYENIDNHAEIFSTSVMKWPLANLKIYENNNLLPSYEYNAGVPWVDWRLVD